MDFDFESIYYLYPRRLRKAEGLRRLANLIKTTEDYQDFKSAVMNYAKECKVSRREMQYIMHWPTFIGRDRWRDYISEPEAKGNQSLAEKIIKGEL